MTNREGNYEINTMSQDGSNPVNVTNTSDLHEDSPAWTPDGRLVFTRRPERGKEANELWIATADGGSGRRLLAFPALAPPVAFPLG